MTTTIFINYAHMHRHTTIHFLTHISTFEISNETKHNNLYLNKKKKIAWHCIKKTRNAHISGLRIVNCFHVILFVVLRLPHPLALIVASKGRNAIAVYSKNAHFIFGDVIETEKTAAISMTTVFHTHEHKHELTDWRGRSEYIAK